MPVWFFDLLLAMIAVMLMSYLLWSTVVAPITRTSTGPKVDSHRGFERRAMERQDRRKVDRGPKAAHGERRRKGRRRSD